MVQRIYKFSALLILALVLLPIDSGKAQEEKIDFVTAIEKVAEKVGPTVVSIKTERVEQVRTQSSYFGNPYQDELFNRFFYDFFGELPQSEYRRRGLGSGVIINEDGYILTNNHVVDSADTISVTLADGREFSAQLVGDDQRSDLAVIKITAPNLPYAKLGNSDVLKIGQWVVAIGNPFGYILSNPEPTVTTGVISALQRSLPQRTTSDATYTDLIQTDAAINPGNSGGPLVNLSGEVIGINVAIFSTTGGNQGIGFAIPINDAKRIIQLLIEGKEITYGWFGISVQEIDQRLANYFSLNKSEGILVSKVIDNSPAQKAGLKDGDIILSIDGKLMKNVPTILRVIGNAEVGQQMKVKVLRSGETLEIPITTGPRPKMDAPVLGHSQDTSSPEDESLSRFTWRGIQVANLTPELAEQSGLDAPDGVIIENINSDSPAREIGLQKGDVIMAVNQIHIRNAAHLKKLSSLLKGRCLVKTIRGYFVLEE